jgi:superfamily II DNA helicase RecQ
MAGTKRQTAQRGGAKKRSGSRRSVAAEYSNAVARAIAQAVCVLTSESGSPVGRRRLVNFLRGNQLPPAGMPPPSREECFGLLAAHPADWIEEVVDRLTERSLLCLEPGTCCTPQGVSLTSDGSLALRGITPWPPDVLPEQPRLGSHPEVESRLRALRAELAQAEGRTAFGIFPNSTLAKLAARKPHSLADLAEIPGLGEVRIRKYGRRILAALRR